MSGSRMRHGRHLPEARKMADMHLLKCAGQFGNRIKLLRYQTCHQVSNAVDRGNQVQKNVVVS